MLMPGDVVVDGRIAGVGVRWNFPRMSFIALQPGEAAWLNILRKSRRDSFPMPGDICSWGKTTARHSIRKEPCSGDYAKS